METYKKGYQLYTIREEMVSDSAIEAALHATKEMGYVQFESFGYMKGTFFGQSPKQFKVTMDSASLSSPSGHYMPMQLETNEVGPLDTSTIVDILDAAEALNQKWVIIPWMSDAWEKRRRICALGQLSESPKLGLSRARHDRCLAQS